MKVELSSDYPTVELKSARTTIDEIPPGTTIDLTGRFPAFFTAASGDFAPARIQVRLSSGQTSATEAVDLMIAPHPLPTPSAVEILDGRTVTLPVFRQKGNQGGGASLLRTITEGKGNGNGLLEPGEEATIWIRIPQGLDPFDKGNWYRAKIHSDSPWLSEIARLEEQKQREWTGAKELSSLVKLSAAAPPGTPISLLLSNETWSFHFTPGVRYGVEPLYQAFQLHCRQVHRLDLKLP
ncbi:MAG: hypothetical protein HZB13_18515 [Acidobacteria bacterium]|nr:hypothetical protein [Acidobacteriota bacterium]